MVWCSTAERVLYGRMRSQAGAGPSWRRLLLGGHAAGKVYEFQAIGRELARSALSAYLESPGTFAIETREGARIDLLATPSSDLVTLECWFFDAVEDLDTIVIRRADVHELIDCLYQRSTDDEVARTIFALAERAERLAG